MSLKSTVKAYWLPGGILRLTHLMYMCKFLLPAIFIHLASSVCAQTTIPALKISHLTGDFYIYTTYVSVNGKPFPANGMYLVTSDGVALFDTPWDSTQFQPLLDSIQSKHSKKVVLCISTHWHDDRTAGLGYYKQKGIKTYTIRLTDQFSVKNGNERAAFLMPDDSTFTLGRHTFRTFYPGKGHSQDNIVIWFEREKILYGGCLIKSTEAADLGNLSDADTKAWETTIKNLQHTFRRPNYIIPGHQDWKSTRALHHTLKLITQYHSGNQPAKR